MSFDMTKVTQEQYEDHAVKFILRTGAKNIHQWEREATSLMKSNSTRAYEKYAKKAGITIEHDARIPYELRLRLTVVAVIMTVSCKTPQQLLEFQPKMEIFCFKMYEDRRK